MTRYAEIEKVLRQWAELEDCGCVTAECEGTCLPALSRAAIALPEDGKVVNAELYGLAVKFADLYAKNEIRTLGTWSGENWRLVKPFFDCKEFNDRLKIAFNYLELREASGEPMPYKVVRDGDKVRFDVPDPPKDGE